MAVHPLDDEEEVDDDEDVEVDDDEEVEVDDDEEVEVDDDDEVEVDDDDDEVEGPPLEDEELPGGGSTTMVPHAVMVPRAVVRSKPESRWRGRTRVRPARRGPPLVRPNSRGSNAALCRSVPPPVLADPCAWSSVWRRWQRGSGRSVHFPLSVLRRGGDGSNRKGRPFRGKAGP
jgi:hypothetical protein